MQYTMQWITDNAYGHYIAPNNHIKEHRSYATQNSRQPSWYSHYLYMLTLLLVLSHNIGKSSQLQTTPNLRTFFFIFYKCMVAICVFLLEEAMYSYFCLCILIVAYVILLLVYVFLSLSMYS